MTCEVIPHINYSDFSQNIFDKAGTKRIPIGASLEVTGTCNVSCLHCYMPKADKHSELKTEEIKRMLDEFAEAGVLWLLITGGEPLLRKDFEEIYIYAKKKGFLITLFTSGTLINEHIADFLADWPPFAVEVTVHSMNPVIFEHITRARGSYDKCMNGIRMLSDRGISLRLKTVLMKPNVGETDGVRAFAEKIGAKYRIDPHIQPKVDGSHDPLGVRLSANEIVDLDRQDKERMQDWQRLLDRDLPLISDQVFACGAGIRSFYVNAEGKLSACTMTQYESYDLRHGNFKEAWHDFLPKVIGKKRRTEYKCGSCELMILCGRCPGWAYLEEGDEEAAVDFLCEVGSLRKRAIDEYAATSS